MTEPRKPGPPPRHTDRDRQIVVMRDRGWSFQHIAGVWGISRERVRQICSKARRGHNDR